MDRGEREYVEGGRETRRIVTVPGEDDDPVQPQVGRLPPDVALEWPLTNQNESNAGHPASKQGHRTQEVTMTLLSAEVRDTADDERILRDSELVTNTVGRPPVRDVGRIDAVVQRLERGHGEQTMET